MSKNTLIGKTFNSRVIDRVTELDNGLMEVGFTDHTFERVHRNDWDGFVGLLEDAPEVAEPEVAEPEVQGLGQTVSGFFTGTNSEGAQDSNNTQI